MHAINTNKMPYFQLIAGFFALKSKMVQHFCFNELCWDGYSRKRCAFTMYANTMEQCADAVARNPACGMQFSYSWGTSLCDCAPLGGYCMLKAYPKATTLEFFKLPSFAPGIIISTTAFATNTNPDVSVVASSKSAPLLQTTISQSTTASSDLRTSSSPKSTASSHIATLSGTTRVRTRPDELTTLAQKNSHSIRVQQTKSPPRDTTQAIKDSSTQFTDFSITSQRSTVQTPNHASSVTMSPSPAPNHASSVTTSPSPAPNHASSVTRSPSPQPETLIPFDCMDWFDGCQNCVVEEGEILMCTNRFCYDLTSGFCREFKDGRLCQDVDCLQPSYATQVYLRTTVRSAQNVTVRGNTTSRNFSQPVSDTVFGFAINAPFVVTMAIMATTTVMLFAVLMTVGSFLLNKNKRKRQQKVTANGSGALRQNAPITKHLKQVSKFDLPDIDTHAIV